MVFLCFVQVGGLAKDGSIWVLKPKDTLVKKVNTVNTVNLKLKGQTLRLKILAALGGRSSLPRGNPEGGNAGVFFFAPVGRRCTDHTVRWI